MKRKTIYWIIIGVLATVAIFILFKNLSNPDDTDDTFEVPREPIHWHPKLTIIIKGEKQFIPVNIGISVGNNMDNAISGMRMSPVHTHESDGTLHLENNRPWQKPETLALGYFFEVWGKNFSSSCIFEYCNGENGTLAMTVNGNPNNEFGNYVMHDRDDIVLEYK